MTEAQRITAALQGRWYGRYGLARCPAHGDKTPSLTLADGPSGRLLAHCKTGCDFRDVLDALRGLGIVEGQGTVPQTDPAELARYAEAQRKEAEKKERQALAVWQDTLPVHGTAADTYLRGRGITCALPDSLRFHPACWHPTAQRLPAMVARIDGADRFAVHRTYLRPDGGGKAGADPAKAMLGAVAGGAVRLAQGQDALAVGEGIETALSLSSGLLRGSVAIWAALSAPGMAGLRLPPIPGRLTVATDGDAPGIAAGHQLAERATALGWQVSLFPAPHGRDWNDILYTKGAAL
jgi:hypothetical protein